MNIDHALAGTLSVTPSRSAVSRTSTEPAPPDSAVYREITRDAVDQAMSLLAERGMARKTGEKWHAIAPGRMEPDMRRAAAILLARRDDLPPDLAVALASWKHDLDAREAGQAATGQTA